MPPESFHPPTPDSSPSPERDYFFESLGDQYKQQTQSLHSVGLLEHIPASPEDDIVFEITEGIIGMDGKQYKLPTAEDIKQHFSQEKYKEKLEQGFTKLLIVPFGYPLATIRARYSQEILKHGKAGTLLDKDGNKLELDTDQPLDVWSDLDHADETGDLVYYPQQFDKQKPGGHTKQELLDDPSQPFPGFHILLIKPNLTIPRQGTATTTNGRKDLETNQSSEQYLKTIQTQTQHHHEQGFTLEDQLILAITHLNQTNHVIDDWEYSGKKPKDSINLIIGNFHKHSGIVPNALWSRSYRQANVGWNAPWNAYEDSGVRVAVG